MSTAIFPAIAGPADPRWGQAIRRGRAEGNAVLGQIRKQLSQCAAPPAFPPACSAAVNGMGDGAIVEDIIRQLRTPSGWWNGDAHARRVIGKFMVNLRDQQLSRGGDATSVSKLDEQGAHAAAGSI